ncbi:MAG: GTP cyclohydrolase I FolE [Elusimicrobiota bacterium]
MIEKEIESILRKIGEDPSREGLKKTPYRVAKAYEEIMSGYKADVDKIFNRAFFKVNYKEMVIVKDIDFYSMCEHHMLPFMGKVHVAYIPNGLIVGLSKIPRIVEVFSRRLQIQERLTVEIADILYKKLRPKGVGVIIEARHLCMTMRGIKNQTSTAVTSSMLGCFEKDPKVRNEFLSLIKQ